MEELRQYSPLIRPYRHLPVTSASYYTGSTVVSNFKLRLTNINLHERHDSELSSQEYTAKQNRCLCTCSSYGTHAAEYRCRYMQLPCATFTSCSVVRDAIKRISNVNMLMTQEVTHATCAQERCRGSLVTVNHTQFNRRFVDVLVTLKTPFQLQRSHYAR